MLTNHPTARKWIYALSVAASVAAVFVNLYSPDLAGAFVTAAGILAAYAGAQAYSNVGLDPRENGLGGSAPELEP